MAAGMVQLLPACGRSKECDTTGGVDTEADTVLLLAEMAQPERPLEQSQEVGLHARTMQDSIQLERGMEDCKITKPANSTVKRYNAALWISDAIRGFRISRCT